MYKSLGKSQSQTQWFVEEKTPFPARNQTMVPWSSGLYPQTVKLLYELQSPSFDATASLFPLRFSFCKHKF
jgi:hypothetical protein